MSRSMRTSTAGWKASWPPIEKRVRRPLLSTESPLYRRNHPGNRAAERPGFCFSVMSPFNFVTFVTFRRIFQIFACPLGQSSENKVPPLDNIDIR